MLQRGCIIMLVFLATVGLVSCGGTSPAPPANTETALPPTTSTPAARAAPTCFEPQEILPVAFLPGGAKLLVRMESGVQIFDLHSGKEADFIDVGEPIFAAAISPDGQMLAWSFQDGVIQLVRLSDHQVMANLVGHRDPVYDLHFSAAGDRVYSASHDGIVRAWSLEGALLESLAVGTEVVGFGLSPDGSMLATIPSDGPVQLWDVAQARNVREPGGSGGYDTSDAHFSPDGQYLAADLATGLFLWRVSDGQLLWEGPANSMAIAYSPDGRFLAYSDIDDSNKVFLAPPDASRVVLTLGQMGGPIWEMFFSPDGSLLAATDGSEIGVWRVDDAHIRYVGMANCP